MVKKTLNDYLIPIFDKIVEERLTRSNLFLINNIDISLSFEDIDTDLNCESFEIPYVYGLRGNLSLFKHIERRNLKFNSYIFTNDYIVNNIELDIDIGFFYNYYLHNLNYNIVSNKYVVTNEIMHESNLLINWNDDFKDLKKELNSLLTCVNFKNSLNIDVLSSVEISSDLNEFSLCIPSMIDISSDYKLLRFLCVYNYLYHAHFKKDYCLYQMFEVDDVVWMHNCYKDMFEKLEGLLAIESDNLDNSIISTYCFDFYISDLESFRLVYNKLISLYSKYELKSKVYILISQCPLYYKDRVDRILNNSKLKNFVILGL